MLLKFTKDGKFLLQIGGPDKSGGNADTKSVNKPADAFVYQKTNELYVADGYGNRRVLVLDADTGAFKRMWGAFGNAPVDAQPAAGGRGAAPSWSTGPGPDQFGSPTHAVKVSNDELVYVADRQNRRVQVFTPAGKYVTQTFVNRTGPANGSVAGIAFSPDAAQRFMYLADYGNSHVVVMDRKSLTILYQFGIRSAAPGDFQGPHHIASTRRAISVAEVVPGNRVQRFALQGAVEHAAAGRAHARAACRVPGSAGAGRSGQQRRRAARRARSPPPVQPGHAAAIPRGRARWPTRTA